LALLLTVPAFADSHARIVRLSYIDGDVELDKADGRGFSTAYLNMPIAHQSKLWARDGEAEVELEDGSSIRLTPDTIVAFTDLSLDGSGHRNTSIELQQGTAYFDIRYHDSDIFELQFGHNRAQLIKSSRFRIDAEKGNYELATLNGEAQVSNGSATDVVVKKDETIRLDGSDPGRYYLSRGVDAETYDGWDNERVKSHDQAATVAASSGYDGLTYGLSDLAAYGNYFYVPGYGYMWRPGSASLGWDPFADGYWVQYPGFGYTFVSGYPWGWAPYRYGSWQFVNGYGWCWHPGANWNTWNTAPAFLSVPPHFHPPERPRHGPSVIVINHGVSTPVPPRQMIVDNDSLNNHRPHSGKVVTADGDLLRRGQGASLSPAAGFVSTRAPAVSFGGAPMTQSRSVSAPPASAPAWGSGPAPAMPGTQSSRNNVHMPSPRMESRGSNPAPAMHSAPPMHTESRSGGLSSGASMHSAPSVSSSAGGHMGGGMSSGGGGGAHSGSGGRSSSGSHR
jgi:hypothetical protein